MSYQWLKLVIRIEKAKRANFGIDGATNFLIRFICIATVHTFISFYVMYFPTDLHNETAVHVKVRMIDTLLHLEKICG